MTVLYLDEYRKHTLEGVSTEVCFFGQEYINRDGHSSFITICVNIEDGDVLGLISTVERRGGICEMGEDGTYYFLPWPCAAVEIRPVGQ